MTNSTQVASNIRALGAFLCVALFASAASATNWYASPDGTGGGTSPTDRGEAITTMLKMASGDTLYFAPGTGKRDGCAGQPARQVRHGRHGRARVHPVARHVLPFPVGRSGKSAASPKNLHVLHVLHG